jgi:uncharacterized protein (DUF433 family)
MKIKLVWGLGATGLTFDRDRERGGLKHALLAAFDAKAGRLAVGNFGFRSGDDRVHGESMEGRITIEPGKRGGQPCVRGMRIAVADVLEYLSHGASREQLMEDFPELEPEDINACLAFAAHRERHLQSMAS